METPAVPTWKACVAQQWMRRPCSKFECIRQCAYLHSAERYLPQGQEYGPLCGHIWRELLTSRASLDTTRMWNYWPPYCTFDPNNPLMKNQAAPPAPSWATTAEENVLKQAA